MKPLRIAFLISAKSGTGKGAKINDRLPATLDELGLSPEDYCLQPIATRDVALQAADLAKNTERLIIVGGDGTAAAALAGARAAGESVPVGIIPVGTGNDLARVTGMHRTLRKHGLKICVQTCLKGDAVPIDIWRINESHFMINYLSIGMDAAVVGSFSQHRNTRSTPYHSTFLNFCMYGLLGVQHLLAGVNGTALMHVKNNGSQKTVQVGGLREVVISNIPSYAAGTLLSPIINYSDQYLDITTFRNIFRFAGIFLAKPSPWLRRWYGTSLPHYRGDEIELQLEPENSLQIDGEDKTHLLENTGTISIKHAGQGLIINAMPVISNK